jgi:hypothetical protein
LRRDTGETTEKAEKDEGKDEMLLTYVDIPGHTHTTISDNR